MFTQFKIEVVAEKITKHVKCLPNDVSNLISPYAVDDAWVKETEEDEYKKDMPGKFIAGNNYLFFKRRFYENTMEGSCLTGIVSGVVLTMFLCIPFMFLDIFINLFLYCIGHEDKMDFFTTKIPYFLIAAAGAVIGFILSIVPALYVAFEETKKRPTGEEVYRLLQKLEEAINNKKDEANIIISNIVKSYENIYDMFPETSRSRDENSEDLFNTLSDKELTPEKKGIEIAKYMTTKEDNAGKELYNIILTELDKWTIHQVDFTAYQTDDAMLFYPMGL